LKLHEIKCIVEDLGSPISTIYKSTMEQLTSIVTSGGVTNTVHVIVLAKLFNLFNVTRDVTDANQSYPDSVLIHTIKEMDPGMQVEMAKFFIENGEDWYQDHEPREHVLTWFDHLKKKVSSEALD